MKHLVVLLALLGAACQSGDEEACIKACSRPFEIVQNAGEKRAKAWESMPDSLRSDASLISELWREELKVARARYLESCVPACQASGAPEVIRCRGRAGNLGEWKRCDR